MSDALLQVAARQQKGRSRVARQAEVTSDVRRFRGVLAGSLVALVCGLVWLGVSSGASGFSSPGPLSHSHDAAGLSCESCHVPSDPASGQLDPSRARACVSCHSAHPSTRVGHQRLSAAGQLQCATCHKAHGGGEVVQLEPSGVARLRRAGAADVEVQVAPIAGERPINVPVVPVGRCSGCHRADAPNDPIAQCLLPGQESLGAAQPTVCFDEHREVAFAGKGGNAERDAAYEPARAALIAVSAPSGLQLDYTWLGFGVALMLGLGTGLVVRRRRAVPRGTSQGTQLAPAAAPSVRRLPTIDESTCIGCNACVDACPYDVLQLERYVAKVSRPEDCCGLTLCEQRCPNGSLVVREGEPLFDRPRVTSALEAEQSPGVYLAGDVTGLPLIRNAINQGAHASRAIAEELSQPGPKVPLDAHALPAEERVELLIVGAGPAGISAALAAEEARISYLVVEQGSVAESVRSFPRGKLVFDQPLGVPKVGELWLEESTKEELLGKWRRIVREHRLKIHEGLRVVGAEAVAGGPPDGLLRVELEDADRRPSSVLARRVLLAVGRRGTPRKLSVEVPDSVLSHVHYHLADARSFAGQRVLVVGLGDVAMETAIALGRQPGTQVSVAYRGSGFQRGKSRNIQELERLVRGSRVDLCWQTDVVRLAPGRDELLVTLSHGAESRTLPFDAVFVMIGSVAPWELLGRFGVSVSAERP